MFFEERKVKTTENLERLVRQLPTEWGYSDFILCGSAALAIRGVRDVHDLDVFIRPGIWDSAGLDRIPGIVISTSAEEYSATGDSEVSNQKLVRLDTGFDFFNALPRATCSFDRAFECADDFKVEGRSIKVLCLRHVLAVKATAMTVPMRGKDWDDMSKLAALIEKEERANERPKWFKAWVNRRRSYDGSDPTAGKGF